MSDNKPPEPGQKPNAYDLAPEPPPPARIGGPGLTDDFDEDADFDRDPEVERALGKAPAAIPATDAALTPPEVFSKDGRGAAETLAMAGGIIAVVACAIAAATSPQGARAQAGVGNLYFTIVHSLTGVAAVAVGAHLQGCVLGKWSLVGARVLFAVAVFQLINGITLGNLGVWGRVLLLPCAAAGYLLALWLLFNWKRDRLFIVAACHGALAIVTWLLLALYAWIQSRPLAGSGA